MMNRALRKIRARDDLGVAEESAIRQAITDVREVRADQLIVREGVQLNRSTLLLDGLLCRFKDLHNGERQITEFHYPGDFADLHSFTLKRLDHNVMSLTKCCIASMAHDALERITEEFPHLTRIFWFMTNLDAAIHREWVLSLGRRSAIARLAHLFCEAHLRLEIVGLADDAGFDLGLTQADLSEALGLTAVHVNRTLKELREQGLALFRNGRVSLIDLPGLRSIAEFDPAYLYLEKWHR
jgi:CRP-like cAMP-binding protein